MITISLDAVKEQMVNVTLSEQQCSIRLVQRESGIYMDLSVSGVPLIQGIPCWYANKMVRYKYIGFIGDLVFLDSKGEEDPEYSGLGKRFNLYYLSEGEIV